MIDGIIAKCELNNKNILRKNIVLDSIVTTNSCIVWYYVFLSVHNRYNRKNFMSRRPLFFKARPVIISQTRTIFLCEGIASARDAAAETITSQIDRPGPGSWMSAVRL